MSSCLNDSWITGSHGKNELLHQKRNRLASGGLSERKTETLQTGFIKEGFDRADCEEADSLIENGMIEGNKLMISSKVDVLPTKRWWVTLLWRLGSSLCVDLRFAMILLQLEPVAELH
ncbi:hypothetical protein L2E82_17190 [Cichorium intybus]|uniref:Uncharacterized protein n=1 Tax=Cichorium intybus TaxID=13427 RepID=A0ACB9F7M0_CICIN|nr:hypothetical protein L2E82_17190 [Cichorium intybus]